MRARSYIRKLEDENTELHGLLAEVRQIVERSLTYHGGAPGGFEVTNLGALIMLWGILAAADQEVTL